jgi:hypothetical protein
MSDARLRRLNKEIKGEFYVTLLAIGGEGLTIIAIDISICGLLLAQTAKRTGQVVLPCDVRLNVILVTLPRS